jgi:hypothetical protein
VSSSERRLLVSAFNGGFKFSTGAGGFMSDGRVATALRDGLGSIVTYADGYTDIGAWHQQLPAARRRVASVRQNLTLLIDRGTPAPNFDCRACGGRRSAASATRPVPPSASPPTGVWSGPEGSTSPSHA